MTKPSPKPPTPKKNNKQPSAQEIANVVRLFKQGPSEGLITLARNMAARFPSYLLGWQVLGIVLCQMGRNAEALESVKNTAALAPHDAKSHYNLGFLFQQLGQLGEAEASYRRTLRLNPAYGQAHSNLSVVYQRLGQLDAAEASCMNALRIDPNYAEAHNNLGSILLELGRLKEAELSLRSAVQLDPNYSAAYGNLGITLQKAERKNEALTCFQQQLQLDPENAVAQYQVALLTGSGNPERAPDRYVENVFDSYAHRFDTHLQQELHYDIPQKILSLISRHSRSGEKLDILDLGCGTGLVGSVIAPFAKQLVGVDLSSKMLDRARTRDLYQRLVNSDLLTMMRQEQASSFDLIIAADVFVYLGRLDEIIGEAKRLLRPNGIFTFSTESLAPDQNEGAATADHLAYRLNDTGRYAHTPRYLTELAARFDFAIRELNPTQIRLEQGKPVNGHLALWENKG